MNMLAPIALAPRLDREALERRLPAREARLLDFPLQPGPDDRTGLPLSAPHRSGSKPVPSVEQDVLALLDRDERILILLVRNRSRFLALAGSWAAAVERHLPALSPDSAEARARKARLSALARFAILYRLDQGGLDFEEEERFARAGFSEAQAQAVRALVHHFDQGWAPPRRRWVKSMAFLALAAAATMLLQRWLAAAVDDSLLAWVLAIVLSTGAAGFVAVTAHPAGPRRGRSRAA